MVNPNLDSTSMPKHRKKNGYFSSSMLRTILLGVIVVYVLRAIVLWRISGGSDTNEVVLLPQKEGYLVFILAMGRYGNQMEHLLSVLGKIKETNRVLVLPPFVKYERGSVSFVPIESIFDLNKLREFYPNIVPMQTFMETIAPKVWKEKILYCYTPPCAIQGNPAQPFWNQYGIENFDRSHGLYNSQDLIHLSVKEHPVVAMSHAPWAHYPMRPEDRYIAKYFHWNNNEETPTPDLPNDAVVVAAHIRAGSDWIKACRDHGIGRRDFMASPQCHSPKDGFVVTQEICLPDKINVVEKLRQTGERLRRHHGKKSMFLYVASDVPSMGRDLMENLSDTYDDLWELPNDDPFVDLRVMSKAHYLVGNCVSSFTSFAARMREKGTEFFGVGT